MKKIRSDAIRGVDEEKHNNINTHTQKKQFVEVVETLDKNADQKSSLLRGNGCSKPRSGVLSNASLLGFLNRLHFLTLSDWACE